MGRRPMDRIATWGRLHPDERSVLIACAAGAGLAATYNVPVAGAIFGIETVLVDGTVMRFGSKAFDVALVVSTCSA